MKPKINAKMVAAHTFEALFAVATGFGTGVALWEHTFLEVQDVMAWTVMVTVIAYMTAASLMERYLDRPKRKPAKFIQLKPTYRLVEEDTGRVVMEKW